jgi:hypothetical protein
MSDVASIISTYKLEISRGGQQANRHALTNREIACNFAPHSAFEREKNALCRSGVTSIHRLSSPGTK